MAAFSVSLAGLAAKHKAKLDLVVRKATLDLFRSVVLKSPIDTGRFRANWNVSYAVPDMTVTASTNEGRGIAEAGKALTLPVGGVVYLANGLPYARRLEYGYSKQAPAGMVRLSIREFSASIERAARS